MSSRQTRSTRPRNPEGSATADLSIAVEIIGKDSFSPVAKGITGTLGGLFDGAAKLGMGVFGITQLAQGVGSLASGMISGNAQMETYQSQLETLMGSADGARERIAQLAQIGADTPFELPQLVASEKILMGFGLTSEKTMKLSGKSLDQFRTSLGDMAAGTGTDLSELTNLWGKFSSGATGEAISRLQELGIVTREQLTEVGVQFSKSGELISPLPQAMEAAMKIADSKFGGGMQKLSQTFEGQMSTLADGFNQAKVAIMAPVFDVLKDSLVGVNQFLASGVFKDALQAIAGLMAGGVKSGVDGLKSGFLALQPALQTAGDAFTTIQQVFAGDWSASDSIDPVVNAIGQLASFVRDDLIPPLLILGDVVTGVFEGDFKMAGMTLVDVVDTWGPVLVDALAGMAGSFLAWLGPIIPPLLQQLLGVLMQIDTWIVQTGLPMLVNQLGEWAGAFIDWVAPLIPPLLQQLGGLLVQVSSFILTVAAPAMVANLLKWGLAFVEWVAPRIPLLIVELLKLEVALIAWTVTDALPAIVKTLITWGAAFVNWVAKDALPYLSGKLAAILTGISDWVAQSLSSVAAEAGKLGAGFVQGIQDGIGGALGGLKTWITDNLANALPEWVRAVLGIHSPSSVFADIGANMIKGLEQGIMAQWPSVEMVIQRLRGQFAGLGRDVSGSAGDWLRAALAITGTPSDWFGDLFDLMQMESGGNPRAINPTEVLGQHASGLMQMLPSTFNEHKLEGFGDIWSPIDNAVSAIRYIKDQHGSVHNIDRSPSGGYRGYAEGGVVPGPPGMGQWAYVHGGERITPPGQGGGGDVYFSFPNYVGSRSELMSTIKSGLVEYKRANGRMPWE